MASRPITMDEHILLMKTMNENHDGFFKRNEQIIRILTIEGSVGLRIGDILKIRLADFFYTDKGYRLKIVEEKTGKERNVPVPNELYAYLTEYALTKGKGRNDKIFTIGKRAINRYIHKVAIDYLEMTDVSSHSWRKMYAQNIFEKSGKDLLATQEALMHSSIACTRRYLSYRSEKLEKILQSNSAIVELGD